MSFTYTLVILLCSNLSVYAKVDLQQTSPSPVCPGDDAILTCTVTVSASNLQNLFLYLYDACDQSYRVFLDAATVNNSNGSTLGRFTTKTVDVSSNSIAVTATIKGVTPNDPPCTGIICVDSEGSKKVLYPLANTPRAPIEVTSAAVSANSVLLSWKPPPTSDTNCPPATYTITYRAANILSDPVVINTTDNATNKTMFNLTEGMEYSFTVAGVDAGGREGENSAPSYIVLDTPQPVVGLKSRASQESVTLFWMPPFTNTTSQVKEYKISHNSTGSELVIKTNYSAFVLENVTPGTYQFTVLAINMVGEGMEESTVITVFSATSEECTTSSTTYMYIVIGLVIAMVISNVLTALLCLMIKMKSGYSTAGKKRVSNEKKNSPTYQACLKQCSSFTEDRNEHQPFQEDCNEYSYIEQESNESCPRKVAIAGTPLPSLATRQYDILSQETFNDYSYIPHELAQRHRQLVHDSKCCLTTQEPKPTDSAKQDCNSKVVYHKYFTLDCDSNEGDSNGTCTEYSLASDEPHVYSQVKKPVRCKTTHLKK